MGVPGCNATAAATMRFVFGRALACVRVMRTYKIDVTPREIARAANRANPSFRVPMYHLHDCKETAQYNVPAANASPYGMRTTVGLSRFTTGCVCNPCWT